ncbi:MAG TPA: hypothetical protein VKE51_19370 [Vicinamibacterales bacterium]|nr:hypothetical protein [Vicinamibacterales bacterium]
MTGFLAYGDPSVALHNVDRSGASIGRSLFRGERTRVCCDRAIMFRPVRSR